MRFTFEQLCKALMGAADYQAIAQRFDTLFLTDVPALSLQVRRFSPAIILHLPSESDPGLWCARSCLNLRGKSIARAPCSQTRDQARRLITLIDELYLHNVRLICTAEVAPEGLFAAATTDAPGIDLEQLQFEGAAEGARAPLHFAQVFQHQACSRASSCIA